jgi:subtilisin family serine protease
MLRPAHHASRRNVRFVSILLSYLLVLSLGSPLAVNPLAKLSEEPARKTEVNVTNAATNTAPLHSPLASSPSAKAVKSISFVSQDAKHAKGGKRDGELLIRFKDGVSENDKSLIAESSGAKRGKKLRGASGIEKLQVPPGQKETLALLLANNPSVDFVEPNYLIEHDQTVMSPNDPRFVEQWALKNTGANSNGGQPGADINVMGAWSRTTGMMQTIIAVVDSGIDFTHPELKNNEWTNMGDTSAGDVHGWDYITESGVIKDENGHGTAIAGIIAAQGNNATGVTGVMWRASLMSLRVLDNTGTGDVATAVEAIDYSVSHGAQAINLSWGTDAPSNALKDAIARAGQSGVVVVCSAGNESQDIDQTPYYPSSYKLSNLISVAATDSFDNLASWSNWGAKTVTVAAPGANILTTQMGGGYWTVTGTSAAAPMVTGVVGLIKSERAWMRADEIKKTIMASARQVPVLNGRDASGGVVDGENAFGSLRGPYDPPNGNGNGNGNGKGQGNDKDAASAATGKGKECQQRHTCTGDEGCAGSEPSRLRRRKEDEEIPGSGGTSLADSCRSDADLRY